MKKLLLLATGAALLFSCSTSNDVVSNGFIQKRKYKKGWHINKRANVSSKKGINSAEEFIIEKEADLVVKTPVTNTVQEPNDAKVAEIAVSESPKAIEKEVVSKETKSTKTKKASKEFIRIETNNDIVKEKLVSEYSTKELKPTVKSQKNAGGSDTDKLLLIIIAIFISWLAVGIYTGWAVGPTLLNLILWLLFFLPGFIHALIVILA